MGTHISFEDERLGKTVQEQVELLAELVFLQGVLERLVELFPVELIHL
jgi:hypothetical protein